MTRLLFVVNNPDFLVSHRLPVVQAALDEGYEVHVAAAGACPASLQLPGLQFHSVPLSRSGMNPIREVLTLLSLHALIKRIQPGLVHLITTKPVLYGGLSARMAGVPAVVVAISGLGVLFSGTGWRSLLVRPLVRWWYRRVFFHPNLRAILQNPQDRDTLIRQCGLSGERVTMIPGSGVDLDVFTPVAEKPQSGRPVVLMTSRLLIDKGVRVYVEAARSLRAGGVEADFWLAGSPDPGNPESISNRELGGWKAEGAVHCLGHRTDIPQLLAKADLYVLPSWYGEGLPRALIEAAAAGCAVVTTDHPGCRDAIVPGETGVLVPVRSATALAEAMAGLLADPEQRHSMGRAGRQRAEQLFSIHEVVKQHLEIYRTLSAQPRAGVATGESEQIR